MNNKSEQPSHPQLNQKPQIPHKPTNHILDQLNSSSNPKKHTTTTTTNNDKNNIMKKNTTTNNNNKVIWDCGSSLYDSVELDSFRKQLDYAIVNSSRSLSMPRLPSDNHRAPPPPPPPPLQQQPQQRTKKPSSSKFSRSFQKLVRSLFRGPKPDKNTQKPNNSSPDPWFFDSPGSYEDNKSGDKYYVVYEKPNIIGFDGLNGLGSIPEVPEGIAIASPQIGGLTRKTMSERFTTSASSRGIYCA